MTRYFAEPIFVLFFFVPLLTYGVLIAPVATFGMLMLCLTLWIVTKAAHHLITFGVDPSSCCGGMETVSFGRRALAVAADGAICATLWFYIFVGTQGPSANAKILLPTMTAIFTVALWAQFGGTAGKLATNMRVVDARSGRTPSVFQSLLRYFVGYPISTLPLGLGFLWAIWDPRNQGWHDKISGTLVVAANGGFANLGDESSFSILPAIQRSEPTPRSGAKGFGKRSIIPSNSANL